jgi:hypothetical protein
MKITRSGIRRDVAALAIPVIGVVAMFGAGYASGAACTAGNPNASVIEYTPTSAFTDHGNGTVTHNLTGLMWKRCMEGLSGTTCATGARTPLTWSNALAAAVADRTGGHADWRLPNKLELQSIVEPCGWGPAINKTIFPGTPALGFPEPVFYTSTTYTGPSGPSHAIGIQFVDGSLLGLDKTFAFSVRLVRGGRPIDAFDAQPPVLTVTKAGTGSGTVTSTPAGIDCGIDCSEAFARNTAVTLTATPMGGSVFVGWLGACIGTGTCNVNLTGSTSVIATFAPSGVLAKIDIDLNSSYDALTDGLLLLRYMFGETGAALTSNALGTGATRTDPAAIAGYLDNIRPSLDVDGNGQVEPIADGLLLMRYMFGLRGNALIFGATGQGATRATTPEIDEYIQSLMP